MDADISSKRGFDLSYFDICLGFFFLIFWFSIFAILVLNYVKGIILPKNQLIREYLI